MKRRNFIIKSSIAAGAIVIPSIYFTWKNGIKLPLHLTYIFERYTIINIGEDYLKCFPDENNEDELFDLLMERGFSIDKKIKEDYEHDRIAVLDGWVLSITEGRQCALFSLTRTY